MNAKMLIITIIITAAMLPAIVTGRPQKPAGVWIGDASYSFGDSPVALGEPNKTPVQSQLSGLVRLQVFINTEKDNDKGANYVKIQESNSTFYIPSGHSGVSSSLCPGKNELMFKKTGKCYQKGSPALGKNSPCYNDFMTFAERDDKPGYGDCYCVKSRGSSTPPVVSWAQDSRCYELYDQGPCQTGEWLIFRPSRDPENELICAKRSCPENTVDTSNSFQKYWFQSKGKCYQTDTPAPDYCGDDAVKNKPFFEAGKQEPVCLERRPPPKAGVRGLGTGAGNLGCKAGYKQLPNGQCKKIAKLGEDD